jgi:SAM-dependent methyltransferase
MHEHGPAGDDDWAELGAMLELEADVLSPVLEASTAWVGRLAGDTPVRRILDLGSGPGAATMALARFFRRAELIAADRSPALLARARDRAWDVAAADRLETMEVDLDVGLAPTGPLDLVWASLVLHHLRDPGRVLDELHERLVTGGLLAVTELGDQTRFLPDDIGMGRPGLEARVTAAVGDGPDPRVATDQVDWAPAIEKAGFTDILDRTFAVDLGAPVRPVVRHLARLTLGRVLHAAGPTLDPEDVTTLGRLVDPDDPDGVLHRSDVALHTTRRVWVARRTRS